MNAEKGGGKDRKGGLFMKKGKILIVGLIALLMAGALVFVSCRAGCEGAGNCKIEIDGNEYTGSICTSEKCETAKAVYERKGNGTYKCDC